MGKSPILKRVALSYEIGEIADTIEAARVLSEAIETNQLGSDYDRRRAPRALTAVLALAWARLRDVTRVVRGDLDPAAIHAHFNSIEVSSLPNEIVLKAWNSTRKVTR